jgi:DNA-3-methyladenine glycosylase I
VAYHDHEWGVPEHDDRRLFEMLILDGAQAGLSWITILRKRENYRRAFHDFDPERIARYGKRDIERLLGNAGIVRNRLKIASAIGNARAYLALREIHGGLDGFLWRYVDYAPKQNRWSDLREVPARTPQSDQMSKDLKKAGFSFVGSTICYAFMQAAGLVNDHVRDCFRRREIELLGAPPASKTKAAAKAHPR